MLTLKDSKNILNYFHKKSGQKMETEKEKWRKEHLNMNKWPINRSQSQLLLSQRVAQQAF